MGYFDDVDNKIDKIQEVGDIERYAGNGFWYNVGSFGIFVHAIVSMILFWSQFGSISDLFKFTFSVPEESGAEIINQAEEAMQTAISGLSVFVVGICLIFLLSIALSIVGLVFNIKAHKAAAALRQKNALNNMATSFNLLWIVLDLICVALNIVLIVQFILQNV
ncbi:MAG: hypothetical protein IJ837_01535 [Clostridia bacterium]|nr:hypothetical protein [Clostridia bacterium]